MDAANTKTECLRQNLLGAMTKRPIMMVLLIGIIFSLSSCGTAQAASGPKESPDTQAAQTAAETESAGASDTTSESASAQTEDDTTTVQEKTTNTEPKEAPAETTEEEPEAMLQMKIGETKVKVNWEDNDSVAALKELCKDAPLTIQMSMYGGFEQVGPLGTRLPSDDVQTTTASGDIMLYSGSQIVVFYGSNSWAYTRLGHIEDQDSAGMTALLGNGDVTITISMETVE